MKPTNLDDFHRQMIEAKQSYFLVEKIDLIQEVSSHAYVEVYNSFIPGFVYRSDCPFVTHNDPSMPLILNPTSKMYYCHYCTNAGNVVGFIRELESCSNSYAIIYLADKYNLDLPMEL